MKNKPKSLNFTPDKHLSLSNTPEALSIKGVKPRLHYSTCLSDYYSSTPSLDTLQGCRLIYGELESIDQLLSTHLKLRPHISYQPISDTFSAEAFLQYLFVTTPAKTNNIYQDIERKDNHQDVGLRLDNLLPFPMANAPDEKLLHSLSWIDTYIKIMVESHADYYQIPNLATKQIVASSLHIYALLVKMNDYAWARRINFNHSVYLQESIVKLIFGHELFLEKNTQHTIGNLLRIGDLSNEIALSILSELGKIDLMQLIQLSIFMGIIWTSRKDIQLSYLQSPNRTTIALTDAITEKSKELCIDEREAFLKWTGHDTETSLIVVLDDNGESVFDLALFQKILSLTGNLRITLLINKYPVSNNISLQTLDTLLTNPYFSDMKKHFSTGRLKYHFVDQPFRSFEQNYFFPITNKIIKSADLAYIKGVNFFETFQPINLDRFYCFTVSGMTSSMLTGCREGSGVFARVPKNKTGYIYHSPNTITSLSDITQTTQSK
ncbi:MAG: hypothetical protein JMN27_14545 [gamma proteobacterium endosymbiont of Lamellibrachia anaximandri]|nr:hypothetical protein [gamma proteobacterium endosymbiont of Lamellibrachia anaximandri]MBL3535032.1 hypothetical protein [gamma proteobacterium endosymbiont of Lamellibrachia anaximandri]